MKRVRYIKTENSNIKVSSNVFSVDNRSYRVRLNLENMTFSIGDLVKDVEAIHGEASTTHKLKIKVKKELERLGVIFDDEKRKKPIEVVTQENKEII